MATSIALRLPALLACLMPALSAAGRIATHKVDPGEVYNYCADSVPHSLRRDLFWSAKVKGHDCKCVKGEEVSGASMECYRKVSEGARKFSAPELKDKGCYCREKRKTWAPQDVQLVRLLDGQQEDFFDFAIQRMMEVTVDRSSKNFAREAGVIKSLASALKNGKLGEQTTMKAIKALLQLAKGNDENAAAIAQTGVVAALVTMLEKYIATEDKLLVMSLFVTLIKQNPLGKLTVMETGGVNVMMDLLDKGNTKEQKSASQVLAAIASQPVVGDCNNFVITKLAESLLDAEVSHTGKTAAVKMLEQLAEENADTLTDSGLSANVIEALVTVFNGDEKDLDKEITISAMKTLAALAGGSQPMGSPLSDRRRDIVMNAQGVLHTLLEQLVVGDFRAQKAAEQLVKPLMIYGPDKMAVALVDKIEEDQAMDTKSGLKVVRQLLSPSSGYGRVRELVKAELMNRVKAGTATEVMEQLSKEL